MSTSLVDVFLAWGYGFYRRKSINLSNMGLKRPTVDSRLLIFFKADYQLSTFDTSLKTRLTTFETGGRLVSLNSSYTASVNVGVVSSVPFGYRWSGFYPKHTSGVPNVFSAVIDILLTCCWHLALSVTQSCVSGIFSTAWNEPTQCRWCWQCFCIHRMLCHICELVSLWWCVRGLWQPFVQKLFPGGHWFSCFARFPPPPPHCLITPIFIHYLHLLVNSVCDGMLGVVYPVVFCHVMRQVSE